MVAFLFIKERQPGFHDPIAAIQEHEPDAPGSDEETGAMAITSAPQASKRTIIQTDLKVTGIADRNRSEPSSGSQLVAWESVFSEIEEEFIGTQELYVDQALRSWPSMISADWLCRRFGIDVDKAGQVIDSIVAISAPYNIQLADSALEYGRLMEAELRERFRLGNLGRATNPQLAEDRVIPKGTFFSKAMISKGRAVWVDISENDCPDIASLRRQLEFISQQRDERIQSSLQGK